MKNIFILLIIFFAAVCIADEQNLQFSPTSTLQEISTQTKIPVKKISQYLKLERQSKFNISLQELGVSNKDVEKAIAGYHQNETSFYTGIVLVGMGIVFVSLLITGLVINSLKHFGKSRKKTVITTPVGTITAPKEHISSNGIVAAITAMFLHDAEERDRIELTWKRKAISGWEAAGMVENKVCKSRRGKL